MSESYSDLRGILEYAPILRVRRNHGLEHATLHVLAERHPGRPLAGHSDLGGFWIIGDLSVEELASAIQEARARLESGEVKLAVHPNCGTNFATSGILAGLAAAAAMFGVGKRARDNLDRLPMAILVATLALIVSQPLGMQLQEHVTTSGVLGMLRVVEIIPRTQGKVKAHRVVTEG
jgi:hypothetical protein